MRNARTSLFALGTIITIATFVGFATFTPDEPEPAADTAEGVVVPSERGSLTGRVAAFVLAGELNPLAPSEAAITPREASVTAAPATTTTTTTSTTTTTTSTTTTTTAPTTTTTAPPATTTTAPTTTTTAPTTTTTAPPVTTTTSVPTVPPLSEDEMRSLAALYFPAEEVEKAVLVARCESNWDPGAYNPSPSGPYAGLYQHDVDYWESRSASAGWAGAGVFDPDANTAVAAWLLAGSSWDAHWPWCSAWADQQPGG